MPWTRLDDGYDTHRKMLAFGEGARGDARRWTWTRILLHTNRHGSDVIPAGIREAIPAATRAYLEDTVTVGLTDRHPDGSLHVHNWILYSDQPAAAKVSYYLDRNPDATANETCRAVGGHRETVLRLHATATSAGSTEPHSNGSMEPVPNNPDTGSTGGTEEPALVVPLARARVPVPSPEELVTTPRSVAVARDTEPQPIRSSVSAALHELGNATRKGDEA